MKDRASARLIASVSKFRPRFKIRDRKAWRHSAILLLLLLLVVVVVVVVVLGRFSGLTGCKRA
jgi:hypothetical protein